MLMHNGMININKEKMSKSLGNFFILRDLFNYFDPMVIRYFFLIHHYRMPADFSFDALTVAQKSYERLIRLFAGDSGADISAHQSEIVDKMIQFLADDLNTPGLFGVLFENITAIAQDKHELAAVKNILMNVLGLTLQPLPEQKVALTPEIQELIDARNKARREKNWARSDELRDQLHAMGVEVHDEKL
jgi:cysteinyl-tRNA synthetase